MLIRRREFTAVNPVSILYKPIAGRYRPVRVADGPIMARYRFIKNAYWERSREKKSEALHVNMTCFISSQFSSVQFSDFNATRQRSHLEAAPDKSGLALLDYWIGLKRCLVIVHN